MSIENIRPVQENTEQKDREQEYLVPYREKPMEIAVEVPGSKSITNRALLMAAMAEGTSHIDGILFSDDSKYFLEALKDLGFSLQIDYERKSVSIEGMGGRIPKKEGSIYVGSAGTAARFLTAFLAMGEGYYQVNSSQQMKKRPMKELLVALESLGAQITYLEEAYTFPFRIKGVGVKDIKGEKSVSLNIDRSSQFLSALLMVLPLRFEKVVIKLTGKRNARSYVEMTEQMMKQFGHKGVGRLEKDLYQIERENYAGQSYQVEPDVSAACYFYAMAAVTGGNAMVYHMRKDSLQGDMRFLSVLRDMGCTLTWKKIEGMSREQLVLAGPKEGKLKGINRSFSDFSDQALTMAAIAPFADSPVTITGIAHTRGQESNRMEVICTELGKMGIVCKEEEDGIIIYPGIPQKAVIETYEDHRVAMAFAVTGLRVKGTVLKNPMCCKKTFPEYFQVLEWLCQKQ